MARRPTPTLRRKELGARLKKLRQARDLTAEQVAEQLMVSTTKISRLETGTRGVNPRDIRDLCTIYDVGDEERERLMTLAKQSRESSWWQQNDSEYSTWLELEAAAASITSYKADVLPGLLQTEDYARAVVEATLPDPDEERVAQLAESRRERQQLLEGDPPLELWTVLDEAVLRRVIGGPAIMHEQVRSLIKRAGQSNVTIQLIPFEAGAHPALNSTFEILHFEQAAPDVVYVEGLLGQHYLEGQKELARYKRIFDQLRAIALGPRDSVATLRAIADSYAG
ncbi:MAG TPA: helix-turn-helix transcriptional regulator [Jatrophihabitantaceae bacterium]|jgi:transcriptional regulator with XRE-family HTH domain